MIEIDECPGCGMTRLQVHGHLILKVWDEGIAKRHARLFSKARDLPQRQGMKLLCEEIGYSESTAEAMYGLLHGMFNEPKGRLN
jgi:hypothetical protein